MALQYRVATRDDLDALAAFWNEQSGWDTLDAASWAARFTPIPDVLETRVVVGENEAGEIRTQFLFLPLLVWIDGREVRGVRPFAPVVAPDARGGLDLNPLHHPIGAMFQHARHAFRDLGDGVLYLIPDPRWRRLFRPFPQFQRGQFPLLSRPLPLADGPLPLDGHAAGPFDGDWARLDPLWEASRALDGPQVVRDGRTLPWKVGQGDYQLTAVERGNDLVGFVASRHKGDRQWLVCDILAADEAAYRATLTAAVNLGHERTQAKEPGAIVKVSVMGTARMEPAALALGFTRERYRFHLIVERLDQTIPKEAAAPGRWGVSPND